MMSTKLDRIIEKAKTDRKCCFTSLAHLLTTEFLMETWSKINRRGTSGVDGESIEQFESNLKERCLVSLRWRTGLSKGQWPESWRLFTSPSF